MTWTQNREELLAQLWANGFSATQIGDRLHLSRNAVIGKAHRLGLGGVSRGSAPGRMRRLPAKPRKSRNVSIAVKYPATPIRSPLALPSLPGASTLAANGKTLGQLALADCRYPYGERSPYLFCGKPQSDGSQYCEQHLRLTRVHQRQK